MLTMALLLFASADVLSTQPSDDWTSYGRTHDETHYSPLADIDASNVSKLSLAWWFDIPGVVLAESVPLQVDGTVYFVTGYSVVRAADAVTGRLLWTYDPKVPERSGRKLRLLWGIRGGIAYENDSIYVGTHDGRLISIGAKTGKLNWEVATTAPDDHRVITGAPRAFNGKVVIGHADGLAADATSREFSGVRGYITTYNARTGEQLWRFHTVPGDPARGFENKAMEMAAKTWSGDWWKRGGGGTVWNAITYDAELNRLYVGTGNGIPWDARRRSPGGGDNLFVSSIVALDADSGSYIWHYQVNPADTWDYDATNDIALARLAIDGVQRRVLMQAPKNGFFYVIDRHSGKLLSAEKFARVTWAERIDLNSGRPVETDGARQWWDGGFPLWPSGDGAHGWAAMGFSPIAKLAYIPTLDAPGACHDKYGAVESKPCVGSAFLVAWDPVRQRAAWRVPLPGVRTGGVLATAGNLVFQGQSGGEFSAYAADSGRKLWSFDAQVGIAGAPISYRIGGRQYVSVMVGYGGGGALLDPKWDARLQQRRLLTFAIDGGRKLPRAEPRASICPLSDTGFVPDLTVEKYGAELFSQHCMMCHGAAVNAGGQAPELRASGIVLSEEGFDAVVRRGLLRANGMPRFEEFGDEEIESIRQYIRSRAVAWAGTEAAEDTSCRR